MSSSRSQLAIAALISLSSALPSGYPSRPSGSGFPHYPMGNNTGIWGTGTGTGFYPPTGVPSGAPGGTYTYTKTFTNTVGETIVQTVTGAAYQSIPASSCLSEVTSTLTHKVTVTVTAGGEAESSPAVYSSGTSDVVVLAAASSTKEVYGAHGHRHGHGHSKFHTKSSAADVAASSPAVYSPIASSVAAAAVSTPAVYSSPAAAVSTPAYSSPAPVESSQAGVATSSPAYSSPAPVASSSPAAVSSAPVSSGTCSSRPSAPGVSSSGKRGAAYSDVSLTDAFSGSSQVTWAYNWGYYKDDGLPSSMEYVPMMWGMVDWATENFNQTVKDAGYTAILGFNEPDMYLSTDPNNKQADMTPQQAADAWPWMEQFSCQARLGSPAVTNGADGMGLSYLEEFFPLCADCTIDFVVLHWYGLCSELETLKGHVEDAWTKFQKPIWVTEFAPNDGDDSQKAEFLTSAMEYLDGNENVERYAYYWVADGSLVSGSSMSTIGSAYAS